MPEGFRLSLLIEPYVGVPLHDIAVTFDAKGLPQMHGEANIIISVAGFQGQLYYVPTLRCHAAPVMLATHPLRLRFWWLMPDLGHPELGFSKPFNWMDRQLDAARLTVAEFTAYVMNEFLDARIEENPAFEDVGMDEWLAQLTVMINQAPDAVASVRAYVPTYGKDVGADGSESAPYLERQTVIFHDNSRMRIDSRGYLAEQGPVYVPVSRKFVEGGVPYRQVMVDPLGFDHIQQ